MRYWMQLRLGYPFSEMISRQRFCHVLTWHRRTLRGVDTQKSVDDLARTMSLNVGKVWLKRENQEVLVPASEIRPGDEVVVHMGNVIPFDGIVSDGEAMVNQASLTENLFLSEELWKILFMRHRGRGGELTVLVKEVGGSSRFEKIVTMIEESEKLKSALEGKAEHLADKLVPYSLGGTALTYLLTRNVNKAISVLMVDFPVH